MHPLPLTGCSVANDPHLLLCCQVSLDYYNRNPVEGDIQWDDTHTVVYPMICSLAGVCAGLFGIGGGIVKGPLMLEMGVDPQASQYESE